MTRCTTSSSSATRRRGSSSALCSIDEKAQGRIRQDVDVDQIALEVIATIMGAEYQWFTDPERVDLATAMETYFDQLMRTPRSASL